MDTSKIFECWCVVVFLGVAIGMALVASLWDIPLMDLSFTGYTN